VPCRWPSLPSTSVTQFPRTLPQTQPGELSSTPRRLGLAVRTGAAGEMPSGWQGRRGSSQSGFHSCKACCPPSPANRSVPAGLNTSGDKGEYCPQKSCAATLSCLIIHPADANASIYQCLFKLMEKIRFLLRFPGQQAELCYTRSVNRSVCGVPVGSSPAEQKKQPLFYLLNVTGKNSAGLSEVS